MDTLRNWEMNGLLSVKRKQNGYRIYTDEDIKNGLIFKQLMPDVEYNEIIADLRAKFIESRFACYQHEMVTKDGKVLEVVSFVNIQNKLLEGHRVLEVGMADITGYAKPVK